MSSDSDVLRLERAFLLFCELGQAKFRGYKTMSLGMDSSKFRRLCKVTSLIAGGFKERDISIIFANVKYPGTAVIDFDQFRMAIEIIALKRKTACGHIEQYIIKCAEDFTTNDASEDPTVSKGGYGPSAGYGLIKKQPKRLRNKIMVSHTSTAFVMKQPPPVHKNNLAELQLSPQNLTSNLPLMLKPQMIGQNVQQTKAHLMQILPNPHLSPSYPPINPSLNIQQQPKTKPVQNPAIEVIAPKPKVADKTSTFDFSLTDYLSGKKDGDKAAVAIDELNRSLKVAKSDSEAPMPQGWDVQKGAAGSTVMLKEAPSDWDWTR